METNRNLFYSGEALKAKSIFYGKKAMVYVEGCEDVNFWDPYFERDYFEIESVNGCQNLVSYIKKLEAGETSFIVACDADYNCYGAPTYTSSLIVTTYGHSIENMMYCPYNINEVVRRLSATTNDSVEKIKEWYKTFVKSAHPLLLREISNQTSIANDNKPKIFGKESAYFCKKDKSYELDDQTINSYCEDNKKYYPQEVLDKAETAIKEDPREERQLIQGHFYTHAVRQFITHLCKNISHSRKNINVSNSALYAMFVHCGLCQQKHCKEKEYLETKVSQAKAILQKGMV